MEKAHIKALKFPLLQSIRDFDKNVPKPNNPHKDLIQKIILKTKLDYQQRILEKKANKEEFTASSLINEQKEITKTQTVEEFYLFIIEELNKKGKSGQVMLT